ncbi:MAG: TRC40/GET3/ArsA family transport-energizing ATPase [Myxococcales bacterium]|nr:TRC40/GET3/ArsA family transport-energizing ATPase [Myxococcales bacterium]
MDATTSSAPALEGPRIFFFSGKGGVGKTTLAAATASHLARRGRRVLITSTDPAHNLADVFDRTIGDRGAELAANLRALEIDASARWAAATGMLRGAAEEGGRRGRLQRALLDTMGPLGEAPGVDEMVAMELMIEAASSKDYDAVIFDTAPTGHALRLLFLPQMLDGWLGKMLALRDAFSWVGRTVRRILPGRRAGEEALHTGLTSARQRVEAARAALTDPRRTHFALVTIPEAISVLESERTIRQLKDHGIPLGTLFVNMLQPASDTCPHCAARRAIHEREIGRIRAISGEVPVRLVECHPTVIRGLEALAQLGERLWA